MKLVHFTDLKGDIVTANNLPARNQKRWTPNRKYIVVMAVRLGMISTEACLKHYKIDTEELENWSVGFKTKGVSGLQVTKIVQRLDVLPLKKPTDI